MLTESDNLRIVEEIMDFSDKYSIYSFADLIDYSRKNNNVWFRVLCGLSGRVIREYVKSKYWGYCKGR
jgi:hypothetical protein